MTICKMKDHRRVTISSSDSYHLRIFKLLVKVLIFNKGFSLQLIPLQYVK